MTAQLRVPVGAWRRCWQDRTEFGFWQWAQHNGAVLMSAETELAAWTTSGAKLWTTFVEPPWSSRLSGTTVLLDMAGATASFDVIGGPSDDAHGFGRQSAGGSDEQP